MSLEDDGRDSYGGFEQGPIRPPSEAYSLLIRVTRNCPWNRCTFCPVYKGMRFSIRPVEHVKKDIDAIHGWVEALRRLVDESGRIRRSDLNRAMEDARPGDVRALNAALHWLAGGMASMFLQDANSLVVKPGNLVDILRHLRVRFPWVERVTSYARSDTLARMRDDDLKAIREAGLTRIHTGLESGCDEILKLVKKGTTKEMLVEAGLRVKRAGIELSEYTMPGLGGRALSRENALETADALNQINPDFIRLRTLAVPPAAPLAEECEAGRFEQCTDVMVTEEILLFIERLDGIMSTVTSDHILNLLGELEGSLPGDKGRMIGILHTFLAMDPERQRVYQVGRRLGIFSCLADMADPRKLAAAEEACGELGVTPDNVDEIVHRLMQRFV